MDLQNAFNLFIKIIGAEIQERILYVNTFPFQ